MDGVFVLDVSNSIDRNEFDEMINFVVDIFRLVNISAECSHAALMLFKANVVIRFDLNEYTNQADLIEAIQGIERGRVKGGGTNTPEAVRVLRIAGQNGSLGLRADNPNIRKIAVFITDGNPALDKDFPQYNIKETNRSVLGEQLEKETGELHGANIYDQIYAIGVGNNVNRDTLEQIADPVNLNFLVAGFTPEDFERLRDDIIVTFCSRK